MEQIIEVRYAGMVVGQATAVRDLDARGVFLGLSDPMPVGTIVSLKIGEQLTDGRVEQVFESSEPANAGMRLRFIDGRAASLLRAPAQAAPPAAAPTAAPPAEHAAAAPADDAGEGESERIPAPDELAGSGPNSLGAGGGRRRRRRR